MIPLTDGESKSYEKQKFCHICKKGFNTDDDDDDEDNNDGDNKKYHKKKIIFITQENLEELLIVFAI